MSSVPHLPWSLFGRLIQISSNRSQNHFDRRPLCTPLYSPVCLLRLLPGHPPPEPLQAPHSIRSRISISAVSVSPVYPSRRALTRVHYVTLHPGLGGVALYGLGRSLQHLPHLPLSCTAIPSHKREGTQLSPVPVLVSGGELDHTSTTTFSTGSMS